MLFVRIDIVICLFYNWFIVIVVWRQYKFWYWQQSAKRGVQLPAM